MKAEYWRQPGAGPVEIHGTISYSDGNKSRQIQLSITFSIPERVASVITRELVDEIVMAWLPTGVQTPGTITRIVVWSGHGRKRKRVTDQAAYRELALTLLGDGGTLEIQL